MATEGTSGDLPAAVTAAHRRNARWYLTGLGFSLVGDTALSLVAGMGQPPVGVSHSTTQHA